ncbi:putative conidiation-specific expression protein [Sphaerosporella brunnea]|uniref:Putative conidiation-specific expression protein n=1 Tax=Sphaerosporella brunnea TaxID=1250544 RepID=A0A5J5EHG5_9PEZI|nr:putative conidiation-specific expression protein [Sphaerosporella brunnea]
MATNNLPKDELREIAAKGAQTYEPARDTSHTVRHEHMLRGGNPKLPGNGNLGNFANRPKAEVRAIAAKGGHASRTGGFASMDPERQREIASMGGHASAASDKPGNFANRPTEEVRELARKGAEARQGRRGEAAAEEE